MKFFLNYKIGRKGTILHIIFFILIIIFLFIKGGIWLSAILLVIVILASIAYVRNGDYDIISFDKTGFIITRFFLQCFMTGIKLNLYHIEKESVLEKLILLFELNSKNLERLY